MFACFFCVFVCHLIKIALFLFCISRVFEKKKKQKKTRMNQIGLYISILFVWIGAWSLIDLTIDKFVSQYAYKMMIYATLLAVGIIVLAIINATTK